MSDVQPDAPARSQYVEFWNSVLVPKFVRWRHILVGGRKPTEDSAARQMVIAYAGQFGRLTGRSTIGAYLHFMRLYRERHGFGDRRRDALAAVARKIRRMERTGEAWD